GRVEAHQREDRRLVRDDLRHRVLLRPPPVRAARLDGPGRRDQPAPTIRRRLPRRPGRVARGQAQVTAILPAPKGWPSILLGRRGAPDATDLDAAVEAGAFEGLRRAIRELGPSGTIAEIEASGLRGRGGAGHLTAAKWRTAAATPARNRYV